MTQDGVNWFGQSWWVREFDRHLDDGHPNRAKALHMLVTHLTPLELECFTEQRFVPVTDSQGTLWALKYEDAPSASAVLVGTGATCWYPGYDEERLLLPKGDIVLGQKFALENGEFYRWRRRSQMYIRLPDQVAAIRRQNPELLRFWKKK